MQRALRRSWALGLIVTGACLVTDEVHFPYPSNLPVVLSESPAPFARFPFGGDSECKDRSQPDSMWFFARVHDRDVEEDLWGYWLVNGVFQKQVRFQTTTALSVERSAGACLPKGSLDRRCNFVHLVVSDQYEELSQRIAPLAQSFEAGHGQWFVIGPSDEQPEATPFDCAALFADAGVDAGVDAGADAAAEGGVQ